MAELGLHFGSKKSCKISILFEDLSRHSVFFGTEVKPKAECKNETYPYEYLAEIDIGS